MTLKEALGILGGYVYEDKPCPVGLFDKAIKLGIEALKREQQFRRVVKPRDITLLPGETKE